jgi:hypothetical protein
VIVFGPAEEHTQTEEVIEVSMGDIDCSEVAMVQLNPIRERLGLRDGGQGVHQHRVVLPINECRGDRIPTERLAEWPWPLTDNGLAGWVKTLTPSRFGDVDAATLERGDSGDGDEFIARGVDSFMP